MSIKRRTFLRTAGVSTVGLLAAPKVFSGIFTNLETDAAEIEKVHIIFKTHLDVGFTNLADKVFDTYIHDFIPRAISLSEEMRKTRETEQYVWTTGSFLIYHFLEKSDPAMRKRMETAIQNGDIAWHGLPFTLHTELADQSLFELGIQLSVNLDKRFGKKTTGSKMTDVPGHSRAIVPLMAKHNITFLHVGKNPASTSPDVPPLFRWQTPDGSEVVIMNQTDYGSTMVIPGTKTAVNISFTGDNHGPQNPEQILGIYKNLQDQFPNARIIASNLSDVANEISAIKSLLPVVTSELGDTWIHGVGSDPLKIAQFREISRLRQELLKKGAFNFGDSTDIAFGIPLLMVAEHTWGLDVKTWLKDWDVYKPEDFLPALSQPKYKLMEDSWGEKRRYIRDGIAHLPQPEVAEKRLTELKPVPANKSGFTKLNKDKLTFDTPFFSFRIDPSSGGIIQLKDKKSGKEWAGIHQPLFQYAYQTFSQADYDRFLDQYLTQKVDWALRDFGKPGQEIAGAVSKTWLPVVKDVFLKQDAQGTKLLIDMVVTDGNNQAVGGSPGALTTELFFPNELKEIHATLNWFNKPAHRLPEASWFTFMPTVQNGNWILDKMGHPVNFRDVVIDGNRKLHAIQNGVSLDDNGQKCIIESLDAPLVAPGERNLLNFDNKLPDARDGVHFNLHNNVWGTNFMMWFSEDMKFRFKMMI
jgi:hypothetical protein